MFFLFSLTVVCFFTKTTVRAVPSGGGSVGPGVVVEPGSKKPRRYQYTKIISHELLTKQFYFFLKFSKYKRKTMYVYEKLTQNRFGSSVSICKSYLGRRR